jgi:WD40 repeat protein
MAATAESSAPSLAERIRPVAAGAPVVAIHFLDRTAAFVLGEEALLFATAAGDERRISVHAGAILDSASDGARILTAGDDGKVVATALTGDPQTVATDAKRRWIDHVAAGPVGAIAWSAGRTATVQLPKADARTLDLPSTVGGLAFSPKGLRLAIAHYGGATLWYPNAQVSPELLEWKGSHLGVVYSPDGKFLITAMHEPAVHGWRLADRAGLRMQGYSARVRALSFTAQGLWLATSGAEQLVLWPFQSKNGPMGSQPKLLAPTAMRVTCVAGHPRQEVVAVGYADGMVLLVRIADGGEILVKRPGGGAISAMAWDPRGGILAFGSDEGEAGVLPLG